MKPITRDEVQDLTTYEKTRSEARLEVIRLRQLRRIQAGDKLSLVFENHATLLYQIHEMVRAERMVDEAAIAHEIETYNVLIPQAGELSATLFIEVSDPAKIRADLEAFLGLDHGEQIWFELEGAGRVPARFEEGHSEPGRIAAVHYVRFHFTSEQTKRFLDANAPVEFVVGHPNYQWRAPVVGPTRASLSEDLAS